jgi:hypothetical protein
MEHGLFAMASHRGILSGDPTHTLQHLFPFFRSHGKESGLHLHHSTPYGPSSHSLHWAKRCKQLPKRIRRQSLAQSDPNGGKCQWKLTQVFLGAPKVDCGGTYEEPGSSASHRHGDLRNLSAWNYLRATRKEMLKVMK